MQMLEIIALENGAHRNQTYHGVVPDGWAVIPDDMPIPDTFPFVNITVAGGVVTSMEAGVMPEMPEPEPVVSEMEQLRADVDFIAIMTGVEL